MDAIFERMIERAMKGDMAISKFLMKECERHFKEFEERTATMQVIYNDLIDEDEERSYQEYLKTSGKTEEEFPRLQRPRIRLPFVDDDKSDDEG